MVRSRKQAIYDFSGFYPYVLVNGSEVRVKMLMDDLSAGGIAVSHFFPSQRPAYNGRFYAYTIRIEAEPGQHPEKNLVYDILERWSADPNISNILEKPPSKQINRSPDLEYTEENTDNSAALRAEVNVLKLENRRLRHENALHKEEAASFEQRLCDETKLARSQRFVEEAFLMFEQSEAEKNALRVKLNDLKEEIASAASRSQREIARYQREMFATLLPDLALLGGSVDILTRELERTHYQNVMQFLMALQLKEPSLIEKAIKGRDVKQLAGAPGWREMHVGKLYRLYYHDAQRAVLISMKKNQEKDLVNILRRIV